MNIAKIVCLVLALMAVLSVPGSEAKKITLKWTKGKMRASGMGGKRHFDAKSKKMRVCSGDVVEFKWSGEQMGLYGFYKESHYKSCNKRDLNYMKNTRSSGSFKTKPNRSGWRYYAYITKADDGACKYGCNKGKGKVKGACAQKIAIFWGC